MRKRPILVDEVKFEDCLQCKYLNRPSTCADCDVGEYFVEIDPEGIDAIIRDRSV